MGALMDRRNELAQVVVDADLDLNIYTHLPEGVALPCAVIFAGGPHIEPGLTFGEHIVRFEVWISADAGDNGSQTQQLDELAEGVIEKALASDWDIEAVSQPYQASYSNTLTISITVSTPVTLN